MIGHFDMARGNKIRNRMRVAMAIFAAERKPSKFLLRPNRARAKLSVLFTEHDKDKSRCSWNGAKAAGMTWSDCDAKKILAAVQNDFT